MGLLFWMRLERVGKLRSLFSLTCFCFFVFLVLLLLNSNLPESPGLNHFEISNGALSYARKQGDIRLGRIAEVMVSMLPDDLAFTMLVPSEEATARVLNMTSKDLSSEKRNDTMAILSRVVGFSTIPQHVPWSATTEGKEIVYDSVSGYRLGVWKDSAGRLVVNNICSEQSDIWRGDIIVHIMSGVIMDAEFEQAFSI